MYSFQVNSREFNINLDNDIETIALFGSCAIGEDDLDSDIDLLFIIENCDDKRYIEKKNDLSRQLGIPIEWISLYKKSSIVNMDKYSSYFLWHLKLEGRILFSRTNFLNEILANIIEYKKAATDLYEYNIICKDIKKSMKYDDITSTYELNILASLARNTCITLCYIYNKKLFGRVEPVKVSKEILGEKFPFTVEEYKELYKFRSNYKKERIQDLNDDITKYAEQWISKVDTLINLVCIELKERGIKYEL